MHFPRKHQVIEGGLIVAIVAVLTTLAFVVSHLT